MKCSLVEQGFKPGSCSTRIKNESKKACDITLKHEGNRWHRLIKSAHLSRPEHYFSIYQSGCNHHCLKCHSWEFTQKANGNWMSAEEIGLNNVKLGNCGIFAKSKENWERLSKEVGKEGTG